MFALRTLLLYTDPTRSTYNPLLCVPVLPRCANRENWMGWQRVRLFQHSLWRCDHVNKCRRFTQHPAYKRFFSWYYYIVYEWTSFSENACPRFACRSPSHVCHALKWFRSSKMQGCLFKRVKISLQGRIFLSVMQGMTSTITVETSFTFSI